MTAQPPDFNELLADAQRLVTRVRSAASKHERTDALDELDLVLDALGHERVGLREHVDKVVRALQGLQDRSR